MQNNDSILPTQSENAILAALSGHEYTDLHPHLEQVRLPLNTNLHNCGDLIEYAYFPLDSIVYLFTTMEDGTTAEAGIVGREGILGISALLGETNNFNQAIVLNSDRAIRIRVDILKSAFDAGGSLQALILRYIYTLYRQISQTSACDRIHIIEGRLCRWLLMMRDRAGSDILKVTQEFISQMLGTRRPYITAAIGILQKENIIQCARGNIKILNRRALEEHSCECYEVIK